MCLQPPDATTSLNYIGKSHWPNDSLFKGWIDSLRVYGRAINVDEVEKLYSGWPSTTDRWSVGFRVCERLVWTVSFRNLTARIQD